MKYSAQYIRSQLAKYITKYIDAVQVVSGDFLWSKGLTVEDYLMHISQPGNRSDKLAAYLVSRFCQIYIGVITKDGVWFMGKNTILEDCHIVLVYLGAGTFRDTIFKSAEPCFLVGKPSTSQEPVDSDYVYNPESPFGSPVPCRHTRSMGIPPPSPSKSGASGSSMEPAESSDSPDEPDNIPLPPPKPKHRHHRKRKPIVMKEKTYRIRHGSRHTQKRCSLCKEKFPSQKELNVHVSNVHSFQFLCKSRKCGKTFSSQLWTNMNLFIKDHFFPALSVEMDFCLTIN